MSLGSSHQNVPELFARKTVTTIPKDQRAIHERPESWAVDTTGLSAGRIPVPDHVLQSAKDAFLKTRKGRDVKKASPTAIRTSPRWNRTPEKSSPAVSKRKGKSVEVDIPRSAPETVRGQPPSSSIVSETPRRAPSMGPPPKPSSAGTTVQHSAPDHEAVEIAPDTVRSTPGPGPSHKPTRPPINYDFPSSGPEEDLEMQVPQAHVRQEYHTQQQPPGPISASTSSLMTTSSLNNTPPCAQPIQSSNRSIEPEVRPPSPKLVPPKEVTTKIRPLKRRFPEIGSSELPQGGSQRKALATTYSPGNTPDSNSTASPPPVESNHHPMTARSDKINQTPAENAERGNLHQQVGNATTKLDRLPVSTDNQNYGHSSPVFGPPSPSVSKPAPFPISQVPNQILDDYAFEDSMARDEVRIVPSTLEETSNSLYSTGNQGTASLSYPINEGRSQSQQEEAVSNTYEDTGKPTRAQYEQGVKALPAASLRALRRQDLMPYALFTATYPSFETEHSGNLWSFIRACVCLDYLRKTHSLRDFLWDEFIRAFSSGYFEYVSAHTSPMPAIEWFNNLGGAPEFTNMVVSRLNIEQILYLYKDTVDEARGYIKPIGDSEHTKAHSASTASSATRVTATQPTPSHSESAKGKRPSTDAPAAADSRSKRRKPSSTNNTVPPLSSMAIQSDISTPDLSTAQKSARSSSAGYARTSSWKYGRSRKSSAQDPERQEQLRRFLMTKAKGIDGRARGGP